MSEEFSGEIRIFQTRSQNQLIFAKTPFYQKKSKLLRIIRHFEKLKNFFFMHLRVRSWTYIQTSFRLKNHHATSSNQARCFCRIFVNQISNSCSNNNEQIRYLFLSICSISIGHLFEKKVFSFGCYCNDADENQIHKDTANTFSLTWRGCVMPFESKACLYVSSIPKP